MVSKKLGPGQAHVRWYKTYLTGALERGFVRLNDIRTPIGL